MKKTVGWQAWVVVVVAGVLVLADSLLSSQLLGLSYPRFSWAALAGAYDTCSLAEALDAPQLTWTTGGSASWTGKRAIGYDGIDAAQSGAIGANQSTWLETTVQGPCKVTWWSRTSSELGGDFLRCYADGVEQPGSLSGETAWQQRMTVVGAGSHTLRWVYAKDLTRSSGSDAAWVDQVQITAGADTDGDGLADDWEWRYFRSLSAVTTNSDCDGDGAGDIGEYLMGTDPTNRMSYLGLRECGPLSPTSFVVRWSSETGIVYRLDHSTNLPLGFAMLTDGIPATPPENAYTDNLTSAAAKFYRVSLISDMMPVAGGANSGTNPLSAGESYDPFLYPATYSLTVAAFFMDKYEVTRAKWDEVRSWGLGHGYTDLAVGGGKASNHPVHSVTWYDVVKWCNARSEMDGRTPAYYTASARTVVYRTGQINIEDNCVNWNSGYRLPTDAEWEYAARGGASNKRFSWGGNTISYSQANYCAYNLLDYDLSVGGPHPAYKDGVLPYTSPVGVFEEGKNAYGLYDMTGNVGEWCWNWRPGAEGVGRIYHPSGWGWPASTCRIGQRYSMTPVASDMYTGFRVVLPSGPAAAP